MSAVKRAAARAVPRTGRVARAAPAPTESPTPTDEQMLLGAVLREPSLVAQMRARGVTAETFTQPVHRSLWASLERCEDQIGDQTDTIQVLLDELRANRAANPVGADYMRELAGTELPIDLDALVDERVRQARLRRAKHTWELHGIALKHGQPGATVAALADALIEANEAIGDPEPIPLGTAPPPAFPLDVFGGWARAFVEALAVETQTPPDLGGMMTLATLSAVCGGKFVVEPKPGYREPINLYACVAMPPASRKTTVFRQTTEPVRGWEYAECKRLEPEAVCVEQEIRVLERRRTLAERAAAQEDGEASAAMERARALQKELAARRAVRMPQLICDDATPEALTTRLYQQGGRLALMTAEGGELFEMMCGRYAATGPNLGVYLKAHAGDPIRVDRGGRAEHIPRPALTIGVTTQPATLQTLAKRRELIQRGLPARFIYGMPPSNLGSRDVDPPTMSPAVRTAYGAAVAALLALEPPSPDEPFVLHFGTEAREALLEFAAHIEGRLRAGGDLEAMGDWSGKLVGHTARITALLHLAAHAHHAAPWAQPIAREAFARARDFACSYLVPHARIAFDLMGDSPDIEAAQRLLRWIKRNRKVTFTAREAQKGIGGKGSRETVVDPGLRVLESHGFVFPVEPEPNPKGGRKPERYRVNARVLPRR